MKKKILTMAIALMSIGLSSNLKAQTTDATANATANAEIISVLTIVNVSNLNFGGIPSPAAETVITMEPSSGGSITSGLNAFSTAGDLSAAEFTINGEEDYAYSIELPTTIALSGDTGGADMTVSNFKHNGNPTGTGGSVLYGGNSKTLYVGADLTIGINQLAGTYSAPAFDVTVSYN